jgi:endonuclease III
MMEARRLPELVDRLARFYGPLPEPPRDAFGLYVWKVLSYQTTPQRRDAALAALRHLRALTPDSLARAARGPLEAAVALAGPLRDERLRALTTAAAVLRRRPELLRALRRPLPEVRAALEQLPRLDDADGDWMLLFAGDHARLPADARAVRVLARLACGDEPAAALCATAAEALDHDLAALRRAVTYLAHHGLTTCIERDPHCRVCPLAEECAYAEGPLNSGWPHGGGAS